MQRQQEDYRDSHNKDTTDVEEQDTVEGLLDGSRDSLPRVLGLTNGDTDKFGTHVGEKGEDESIDESTELAEVTSDFVSLESSAVHPVGETDTGLTGDTSEVDNETDEDEAGEGDDLDQREPEFNLAEPLDTQAVDSDDEDDKDSAPCGGVDGTVPKLDDEGGSDDLVGGCGCERWARTGAEAGGGERLHQRDEARMHSAYETRDSQMMRYLHR